MATKTKTARVREQFDPELALTNDIVQAAQRLACSHGWRVALRAVYYAAMRISESRGRKTLAEFLSEAGW